MKRTPLTELLASYGIEFADGGGEIYLRDISSWFADALIESVEKTMPVELTGEEMTVFREAADDIVDGLWEGITSEAKAMAEEGRAFDDARREGMKGDY